MKATPLLIQPRNTEIPCPIFSPFFWRKGGRPQHYFRAGSAVFFAAVAASTLALIAPPGCSGQEPAAAAIEQSSQQPIPNLVHTQGTLAGHAGESIVLRFAIYASQSARDPLWSENQLVSVAADGEYSVLLGAGSAIALPQALFIAGEPRWLAVSVGELEESRTLLTSVPYAMKAADADSLAGQPATAFVTQQQLAARLKANAVAIASQPSQPLVAGTLTGTGTTDYVPLWTSASGLGNSVLFQSGTGASAKIGIATTSPGAKLDVNGPAAVRGKLNLIGPVATATAPGNSPVLQLSAFSFKSGGAAVGQNYQWQAQATGNNTANPSAQLALLFGSGPTAPSATGLSIAPSGVITFAPGQSFPSSATDFPKGATFEGESFLTGASTDWMLVATNTGAGKGTILGQATGTSTGIEGASPGGIGVEGASDSGYGLYGISNTSGTAVYGGAFGTGPAGNFWSQNASGPAVTISNVAGGTGLSATATNAYAGYFINLSTTQATVYATAGGQGNAGYFGNNSATHVALAGVNSSSDANAVGTYGSVSNGKALYGVATGGIGVYGASGNGYGGYFTNSSTYQATVYAANTSNGNAGYFGNNSAARVALAGVNTSTDLGAIGAYGSSPAGKAVYGTTPAGWGVYGTTTTGTGTYGISASGIGAMGVSGSSTMANVAGAGKVGVLGVVAGGSPSGPGEPFTAAVWGNTGDSSGLTYNQFRIGVLGTASDGTAGSFFNNSQHPTITAFNYDGSTTAFFKTFAASSPSGTCGVGGSGDLTCTGRVRSVVTTASQRQVETYSVQSSENWLEDYGSGKLENGIAVVHLDPAFADAANTGVEYHVFLTPKGDAEPLFVTNETASAFEVRESHHGVDSIGFDYRIVAKRIGHESERLVDVTERLRAETENLHPRRPIDQTPKTAATE